MGVLRDKTIVLGVCGGIAAYKAAALTSKLSQAGAKVRVIMTQSAVQFVAPLTFQTLSRHHVFVDTFDEKEPTVVSHIDLADSADLVVIAPATANTIGKFALGLGDDMLSTMLLASTSPVWVAPAMNVHMYENPAVQHNMQTLRDRGVRFIEPGEGQLACGYVGKGRLAEPEEIFAAIERHFAGDEQRLHGRRVLVTAGGTVERIDPVRYIANDSSGKMGYAIAEEAVRMGARVTLVTGPTALAAPQGVQLVAVKSALEMREVVLSRLDANDLIVKAAAVSDYRPAVVSEQKIKKNDSLTLELVKNPDILQEIGALKKEQFVIGFAAETERLDEYALDKLVRKNCDLIVGNDVSQQGAGFSVDTNAVRIFDRSGLVEALPVQSKKEVARRLLELAAARMPASTAKGEA